MKDAVTILNERIDGLLDENKRLRDALGILKKERPDDDYLQYIAKKALEDPIPDGVYNALTI